MKVEEIAAMDKKASEEKLAELKKELVKMNAQVAIGSAIKNTGQIRKIKKTIARIYTVQKEQENGMGNKSGAKRIDDKNRTQKGEKTGGR